MINDTSKCVWVNKDGELCIRYMGGFLCKMANGWEAHSRGGSVLGPFKSQGEATRALDAWG